MPVELKYHAQTLKLLGIEPKLSARALKAIEGWEAKHGRRLPASIREWYSLTSARLQLWPGDKGLAGLGVLLRQYARSVERIARLKTLPVNPFTGKPYTPRPKTTLLVARDEWPVEVLFDGSDDPDLHAHPEDEPKTFAEFVRDAAWETRAGKGWIARVGIAVRSGAFAIADPPHLDLVDIARAGYSGDFKFAAKCGPPHLDFLWETFTEYDHACVPEYRPAPKRVVPATHVYRLFDHTACVALWTADDPTIGVRRAGWLLTAGDEAGLFSLYERMWPCHGHPVQVYAPEDRKSANRWLRARFRKRFPKAPQG